jgi:SnoaL-like domain
MSHELQAESDLRRLIALYTDAVWRQDEALYGDCWASDAEWKILGMHVKSRDAIVATWKKVMADFEWTYQVQHSPVFEIARDTAAARVYVHESFAMKNGFKGCTLGLYHDRYARDAGRWRFAWRHFDLFYFGPTDLSGKFFTPPSYGPPPHHPEPSRPASPPASELM